MEKLHIVGQTKATGFPIGVRKTIAVPFESLWDFMFSAAGLTTWLGTIPQEKLEPSQPYNTLEGIEGKVNVFQPGSHIRLTWRPAHWCNFSHLQSRILPAKNKTTISFHLDHLLDPLQRMEMKKHWEDVLLKIKRSVLK